MSRCALTGRSTRTRTGSAPRGAQVIVHLAARCRCVPVTSDVMPHGEVTLGSTDRMAAVAELRAAVTDLKVGAVPFVEGVRRILSVRQRVGAPDFDGDFLVLAAVDSQSDHLPVSGAKLAASPAWLQQSALEEKELRNQTETAVWAACDRLIERFAREA